MTSEERVSRVEARCSEALLRRVLSELAPMQALSAPLRSVAGASGGGGAPEETATERAIDRGDLTRARRAGPRLSAVARGPRAVLVWLTDYAHGAASLDALGSLYATACGPGDLRQRVDVWQGRVTEIASRLAKARQASSAHLRSRAPTPKGDEARASIAGLVASHDSAAAQHRAASAALAAWGVAAVSEAAAAWTRAGEEREDAA